MPHDPQPLNYKWLEMKKRRKRWAVLISHVRSNSLTLTSKVTLHPSTSLSSPEGFYCTPLPSSPVQISLPNSKSYPNPTSHRYPLCPTQRSPPYHRQTRAQPCRHHHCQRWKLNPRKKAFRSQPKGRATTLSLSAFGPRRSAPARPW